jgi:hypothetical protein
MQAAISVDSWIEVVMDFLRKLEGGSSLEESERSGIDTAALGCYIGTMVPRDPSATTIRIERVQTGVRIEKRLLKVLKGLAGYLDMSLGDLLEGIALAAFEGRSPFVESTLQKIEQLKDVYGMDYGAEVSHQMIEENSNHETDDSDP